MYKRLIYYKYKFEKNGYTVGKLIVVGKNALTEVDQQYLAEINNSGIKIEYLQIPIK